MASDEIVQLPKGFLLGTGSSAYQVEGGWDADGKTPSIWDTFFHSGLNEKVDFVNPHGKIQKFKDKTVNEIKGVGQSVVKQEMVEIKSIFKGFHILKKKNSSLMAIKNLYTKDDGGMIACDSYHKTDIDVQLLKDLGVQVYRFSLSWPRLLPHGDDYFYNDKGIAYYKNLIQKLLDNGIEPLVTIYHWDLPEGLQKLGGWANTNIIRYFTNYCNFVFETFGDKVKYWSTINEPRLVAEAYAGSHSAPALGEYYSGIVDYMVVQNLLLAHAYAYKLYNDKYRGKQQGQISLCVDTVWFFPYDRNNEEHKRAAELAFQSFVGIFIQPLVTGEYPENVVKSVNETNKQLNKKIWRIFPFTEHEKELLKGAYDFIAFNYYFSWYAKPMSSEKDKTLKEQDLRVDIMDNDGLYNPNDINEGFRNVLYWFDKVLNHPKIFICENGFPESEGEDKSLEKKQFHYNMLYEVYQAIKKKNINVFGYCVWSFMDSLEWGGGYKIKYGIYGVDFKDPSRPRYKKENIFTFFERLFKTKTLPPPEIE
ncbi:cytosolic beta-glucosidase-like [Adelges cooleyi]|uniref:cytosolic beta-glucosidase-like n=1 Tax=Adelges cooleyi TaxID=133065 RepID=UPI00217F64D6|nr:cytosolic beta-glucosidase-like [Adelges cooleyi]XP_050419973.1 cytosolic beta-glucosidase-like [Adelges cooleyi]XP_050419974.1 cytosolic beta-glucosidase-like [Adelges cooleyi]